MKLSTAAVIIAAGTSNVFSPNVVLAGKAGKLAPKASKAKTAKAHPSLSYSMSTGPPPCPCFDQEDLLVVTSVNVDPGKSDCDGEVWSLENEDGAFFVAGEGIISGEPYCDRSGLPTPLDITTVEEGVCIDLLTTRCKNIGLLPVPPPP